MSGGQSSPMLFDSIRVERIRLHIQKFDGILNEAKLLLLSDLHISRFNHRERKVVRLVNQEEPDVILVAGDLVVNYKNDFSASVETLSKLKAKYGIFAVLGNSDHTFQTVQDLCDFESALRDIDVILLNNRNVEMKINGKPVYVVGVDDPFFLFDDCEKAMNGVPSEAPMVLLAHSPDILFPRADALVINLLDSPEKKDHFKNWGWEDSTHFGPENGDVYFQNDGSHTIRVQSRQDGVFLDTILLNPYEHIDGMLMARDFEKMHSLLTNEERVREYPDLVVISASDLDGNRVHGKWKRKSDSSALCRFRLDDCPPRKEWHFQPLIDPEDYFETDFLAKKGVRYHAWMRMKAYNGSPKNDSVYLQFSDSIDRHGTERYRIGKPACAKDRVGEVDLILTGHTHGGQIRIPFYGPITTMTSMGKRYDAGLHRLGTSVLYVSRGIGYSVLPLRLFCPPEITVFTFS
jgi:predicted MPP superfamily phosphohydrolase